MKLPELGKDYKLFPDRQKKVEVTPDGKVGIRRTDLEWLQWDKTWEGDEIRRLLQYEQVLDAELAKLPTWSARWWSKLREINRARSRLIAATT